MYATQVSRIVLVPDLRRHGPDRAIRIRRYRLARMEREIGQARPEASCTTERDIGAGK
jgi:predicted secreted Zn-dependent protease